MPRVTVIVRAYNKEGYHKDIATLSEQQVHIIEKRVKDSAYGACVGVTIAPELFPEMVYFEVIVRENSR